jgi:alpha-L-fucosidase
MTTCLKSVFSYSLIALLLLGAPPDHARASETPAQKSERLRWWREARFGMFIHWGPVSLMGTEISWSRGGERRGIEGKGEIPVAVYDSLYTRFNPVRFNAAEWVSVAGAAGMKYMVLTAKHCDGFCLWRSEVDWYCMSSTPFRRDVCGELAHEAHERGMKLGWYYSPMDWRDPDCRTERNAVYLKKMFGHLRELLGNYGTIDLLWFDYDGGPAVWDPVRTYGLVRSLQPRIIMDERLSLGPYKENDPLRIDSLADYRTPEQRVGAFDTKIPWETCMTLGTQWSWKPADTIKTPAECIRILVGCATGDGNLLLDVGPMPDGRIEPRQVSVLKEIGVWLGRYGESIYGTRGGPFPNGSWGGATCKGNVVYLHIVRWDRNDLRLPPLKATIRHSTILTGGTPDITQGPDGTIVRVPVKDRDLTDTIVRLELDAPVEPPAAIEQN